MNMLKKISVGILAGLMIAGCSLDRSPLNGPSSGSFPASESEAEAGVLAAYKRLSILTVKESPFLRHQDNITDIGSYRSYSGNANQVAATASTLTSDNDLSEKLYSAVYRTAGRVHLVLDNIDRLKGVTDDGTINAFRAELLLIRDYYYDVACQYYGDIPFIDHSLDLDDYSYPRIPRADVTKRILYEDLTDDLLDALPIQWDVNKWGTTRLGRAAAYAVKARIALNWGEFTEAARCSAKAIDLSKGIYELQKLNTTYYESATDGEPDPTPLFGLAGQTSKEWMWAIQYNHLVSGNFTSGMYYFGIRLINGCSWFSPQHSFIETFQCTDGLPITESPLYDWTHPYRNRDPRLDLYCCRNDSRVMGVEFNTDGRVAQVRDYNTGNMRPNNDGESPSRNNSTYGMNGVRGPGGYAWRKVFDRSFLGLINGTQTEDDINVGLMRYAELLLIDAEANIEMPGGDLARAAADINQVRARVGMPAVTATDQAGLRSALRYERKVELCCEGLRWFDIRRWHSSENPSELVAEKAINGPVYGPPLSVETSNTDPMLYIPNGKPIIDKDWTVKYDGKTTWDGKPFNLRKVYTFDWVFNRGKDELWPYPKTEIDVDPKNTYQNPGY